MNARSDCDPRKRSASLTVEAAFILPIFIYAFAIFLYLFQFILIQQNVQKALHETANYFTKNAYVFDRFYEDFHEENESEVQAIIKELGIDEMITSAIYKKVFCNYADKSLSTSSLIHGGMDGITIQPQLDYYEDDVVDLCAYYQIQIPVLFFPVKSYEVAHRVKEKNWTGHQVAKRYEETQEEKTAEEVVYITETGKKYHTHSDCSHLKLSVKETTYQKVGYLRNKSQGRYSKCQICAKGIGLSKESIVYVTDHGDRYHISKNCSGLKRNVKEVSRNSLSEEYTCCKRCENRDQKE